MTKMYFILLCINIALLYHSPPLTLYLRDHSKMALHRRKYVDLQKWEPHKFPKRDMLEEVPNDIAQIDCNGECAHLNITLYWVGEMAMKCLQ